MPEQNPYYPFKRVISANQLKGAELIPYKILRYLMDLPDAAGHVPFESNDNPRARLMRYLWNDGARPLNGPLPTPQEKLSMLFDPENPDPNTDEEKRLHPKGYRIYGQRNIAQSLIEAKTLIKLYVNRVIDDTDFVTSIGLACEIWTDPNLHSNTKSNSMDRTFNIEQCLREALAGVDVSGVGTVKFSRNAGSFNGSEVLYSDAGVLGRIVYFSVLWSEGGGAKIQAV